MKIRRLSGFAHSPFSDQETTVQTFWGDRHRFNQSQTGPAKSVAEITRFDLMCRIDLRKPRALLTPDVPRRLKTGTFLDPDGHRCGMHDCKRDITVGLLQEQKMGVISPGI